MAFLNPKAAAPKPKGSAKPQRPVDLIQGYAEVAAIDACIKSLQALLELKKGPVAEQAKQRLIARGLAVRSKPDTISLGDRGAGGSCYIRRKDSRQALGPDELELIAGFIKPERDGDGAIVGIPGLTESVPPVLALNPDYQCDTELLAKIDRALAKVPGMPDDLIIQAAPAKVLVAEQAFDRLFGEKAAVVEAVFDTLGSAVLKPVFKDVDEAWRIVTPMLQEAPAADAEPRRKRA